MERKETRGVNKTENNTWKEKEKKGEKKLQKTANFGREETKFASCDIPIKYEITLENGEV